VFVPPEPRPTFAHRHRYAHAAISNIHSAACGSPWKNHGNPYVAHLNSAGNFDLHCRPNCGNPCAPGRKLFDFSSHFSRAFRSALLDVLLLEAESLRELLSEPQVVKTTKKKQDTDFHESCFLRCPEH
jgi:hypothetical protein